MNFTSPYTQFKEPESLQATSFEVFLTNPNCNSVAAVGAVVWNNVANPASWTSEGECYINGNRAASYDLVNVAPSAKFANLPIDSKLWIVDFNDRLVPYHFKQVLDEDSIIVFSDGRTSHTNLDQKVTAVAAATTYTEEEYLQGYINKE